MKVEEFLKEWKKENNTDEAVYSDYHIDAIEAYAKFILGEALSHQTNVSGKDENVRRVVDSTHIETLIEELEL